MRAECFRSFRKPSIAKLDEKYHIQFPKAQPCLLDEPKTGGGITGARPKSISVEAISANIGSRGPLQHRKAISLREQRLADQSADRFRISRHSPITDSIDSHVIETLVQARKTLAVNVRAIVTREDARRARRVKASAISVRPRTSLTISEYLYKL